MHNTKKLMLSAAIATTLPTLSLPATAELVLEEVVVTARKREESIQDVPVAVTAVTSEMFERATISTFEEATALAPGFNTTSSTVSPMSPSLSMRGSVQNDAVITADPSVGVYVDGVYIARAYGIGVNLVDLQSLEVLKGPQGTLFGRNSTAGALLLTSNDPILDEFSGSASATYGPENSGYQVVLNVPLGDKFALRVAHQKSDREDYIDNVANDPNNPVYLALEEPGALYTPAKTTNSEIGGSNTETTRIKLLFAPTDTTELVLAHEEFESELNGPARDQTWISGITVNQPTDDDEVSLSFDPFSYAKTKTDTFTLRQETDFGDFKFIASTREYRSLNESDYDGGDWAASPADLSAAYGFPAGTIVVPRRHGSWGRTLGDQDSYELQYINSFFNDRVDLTTGITYFKENAQYYDYSTGFDPYTTGILSARVNIADQSVKATGTYAQATIHITDKSNLTLGLRRSEEDKTVDVIDVANSLLPTWNLDSLADQPLTAQSNGAETFKSTDWLVSYDYQLNDDTLVYGKVSTGFRSGGFNGRPLGAGLPFSFDPEEIIEYELGIKADLLDGQLRWNTAIYTNETSDKQFSVLALATGSTTPSAVTKNAGDAESKGLETEFTYLFNDNWSLSGSYAYIDAQFTSLIAFDSTLGKDAEVSANRLPNILYVPENEWTLSLNYDKDYASFNLRATATYHWIDEMYGNTESPAEIEHASGGAISEAQAKDWEDATTTDAYGTLNLNAIFTTLDDKYSVSLWGKNVLDERAVQSSVAFILNPYYAYGNVSYTQPRTWGVTVKASF